MKIAKPVENKNLNLFNENIVSVHALFALNLLDPKQYKKNFAIKRLSATVIKFGDDSVYPLINNTKILEFINYCKELPIAPSNIYFNERDEDGSIEIEWTMDTNFKIANKKAYEHLVLDFCKFLSNLTFAEFRIDMSTFTDDPKKLKQGYDILGNVVMPTFSPELFHNSYPIKVNFVDEDGLQELYF
jgi:hypothetical protein